MTAPGDLVILYGLLVGFVACCAYAAGRVHQRRRHNADRAEAYRDGYATGTRSVFSMAARAAGRRRERSGVRAAVPMPSEAAGIPPAGPGAALPVPPSERPAAPPAPAAPQAPARSEPASPRPAFPVPEVAGPTPVPEQRVAREGRHMVPEELVRAATYRLPPDRVARAKVAAPALDDEDTRPHGPGPRSPGPRSPGPRSPGPRIPGPRGS
ncbi:hypothetical protein [Actinoplanes sp. DH11]|uniref:hypothetical protein n=1 Tax=Actinoplanes sp. DH11 TaxID=2857011 RepID=UPI001E64AAD6|nr:hypothetical protein [Actinoplanes sp. DH11]